MKIHQDFWGWTRLDSNQWPLRCQRSTLTNWATSPKICQSARDRNRTGTGFEARRILSPVRLPVPPPEPGIRCNQKELRRRTESNCWWGFCRALPYHLATSPNYKERKKNDQNPWLEFWSSSYTYLYYLLLYSRSHLGYTKGRARDETRTRDINLGKVALYQLSYSREKTPFISKKSLNIAGIRNIPKKASHVKQIYGSMTQHIFKLLITLQLIFKINLLTRF